MSFVFGDNHAVIRFSDCGDDHVERAAGPSFRRTIGHQPRPNQAGLFVEREHSAGEQRLGAIWTGKPAFQLSAFLAGGFSSIPRRISAAVSAEINRSSSDCSVIHATSASDGTSLVTWLMILVSRRLRLTGQPCGPESGSGSNPDRLRPEATGVAHRQYRPFRLFLRDRKTNSVTNTRRIRATVSEPLCKRPDQLAIGVEPQDLESGHPSLAKTLPVAVQRSFLRRGTYGVFLRITSNISRL